MSFPYALPAANTWSAAHQQFPQQVPRQSTATMYSPVQPYAQGYSPLQSLAVAPVQNNYFAPAPSYPVSNMPGMWNRLHPYIQQSPTLTRQLAQLAQTGWNVKWTQNEGCSCDTGTGQISLNAALPEAVVMQFLAHETRHAFDAPVHMRFYANDVDFAAAKMRDEATAVVNHMRVRSEIFQGCGQDIGYSQPDSAYYENALNFSQWHGNEERLLQHIQRLMAWEVTGVHNRPYWEVYLNVWRGSRGLPHVSVPQGTSEGQRAQAWSALAGEMNNR